MDDKEKKILDFNQIKSKLKSNENDFDTQIGSILDDFGIDKNSLNFDEILSNFDIDDIVKKIQNQEITQSDINKYINEFKNFEKNISNAKKTYRSYTQWRSFYKPYNLSTLFTLEQIVGISKNLNIEYSKIDSKNAIIEKIKPFLVDYLKEILIKLDNDAIKYFGLLMYNEGKIIIDKMLSEEDEFMIDFLQQKCLVARINEKGKFFLIIPEEIFDVAKKMDFSIISRFNNINNFINKTVIAFANSYGVYPKKMLLERLYNDLPDKELLDDVEVYINKHLECNFNKSGKNLSVFYSSIKIDDNYIKHGIIDITNHLFDLQNENVSEYKFLSNEEILKRGKILYFEDSIYLNQVVDVITSICKLDLNDISNLKNIIYIFSYIEFTPNLILQIILSKYDINILENNLSEILESYYKNSAKWILKGHTSFEVNYSKKMDISNVIKIDFKDRR